ncbi:MAG: Uma2 family endonuclease [Prochlorothrix sp.]
MIAQLPPSPVQLQPPAQTQSHTQPPAQPQTATVEAYFALEAKATDKHEYSNGVITPMVGGTPNHNRIAGNLYAALYFALKKTDYDIFMTDQRLQIPEANRYTYPDILVTQGEIQLMPGRTDTLLDAVLIVEVLSDSTAEHDRTDKFANYKTLPSFQEYILINQYRAWVDHYWKQDDQTWMYSFYNDLSAMLTLKAVPFEIEVAELYDRVQLSVLPLDFLFSDDLPSDSQALDAPSSDSPSSDSISSDSASSDSQPLDSSTLDS